MKDSVSDYFDAYEKIRNEKDNLFFQKMELVESEEILNEAPKFEYYTDGTSFYKRVLTVPDPTWEILLSVMNVKKDNCSWFFKWFKPKDDRNAKWISQKRESELAKGSVYRSMKDMKEIAQALKHKHGIELAVDRPR